MSSQLLIFNYYIMSEDKKYEFLNINETLYKTQISDNFKNRKKWEIPDVSKVFSFIPGTIEQINIEVGSKVNEGDDLLILEAMKMRNRIKAPISGTIKTICVKINEIIPKNHLLVEFE